MIKVTAIYCERCNSIIYSRARHDCRSCNCGTIFIDGGFDYIRVGGKVDNKNFIHLEINATKKELYQDWNISKDKFGLLTYTTYKGNDIANIKEKNNKDIIDINIHMKCGGSLASLGMKDKIKRTQYYCYRCKKIIKGLPNDNT